MVIVCDSCGTRFHLADSRVGPKGVKVRCSNCHHRFHVAPASNVADVTLEAEEPAPVPPPESDPDLTSRSRKLLGDPDLDNPRFLFDVGAEDSGNASTAPEGLPSQSGEISESGEITQMHEAPAGEDDATPPGGRASTPLMGLDTEVSFRQKELLADLGAKAPEPVRAFDSLLDDPFDFNREEDLEHTPLPGREPTLAVPAAAPQPAEVTSGAASGGLDVSADEVEEAISRWDAPVAAPVAAARRVEVLRPRVAPAASEKAARAEPVTAGPPREVQLPAPMAGLAADPASPLWLQVLVALIGALLIGAAARLALRSPEAPLQFASASLGWTAEQVQARFARDAAGEPALEIHGSLRGAAGAALPRVEVVLLDAQERPIGAGIEASVDSTTGATGFAALLPEPPARAERFRIELSAAPPLPPPAPSDSTTTAAPVLSPAGTPPAANGGGPGTAVPPAAPAR